MHRRFGSRWRVVAIIFVVLVISLADRSGWLLVSANDDFPRYHGRLVRVVAVIDGDTIEVDLPDLQRDRPTTRIRLWGLDCPELARAGQPAEHFAQEAKQFLQQIVQDQSVELWLEPTRLRGRYGRILAHVHTADGTSVNAMMLEAGLGQADDRWPHALLLMYDRAEAQARRLERGLWQPATAE